MKSESSPTTYDIIIIGAGAAGLSLAYFLSQSSLSSRKIAIIDKDDKNSNDRTWCFWTKEKTGFEEIVYKSWSNVIFRNKELQKTLNISPYQYQMIRGIDFYQFIKKRLRAFKNIEWKRDDVRTISSSEDGVSVQTESRSYKGKIAFNSIPPEKPDHIPKNKNYLLQHFKGKVIETYKNVFDSDTPYLMDFSVDQCGQTRFGYVLPFTPKKALVEFTIFSEELLDEKEYDHLLNHYLKNHLQIDSYKTMDEEFGIIPMTDIKFEFHPSPNIFNIGTLGGMTKASTGYTFGRIIRETKSIVARLEKEKLPSQKRNAKFLFFDSVLLHVLAKNLFPSDKAFSYLFLKNNVKKILKFLDEETSFTEDIRILNSLPMWPFLKGAFYSLFYTGIKKLKA